MNLIKELKENCGKSIFPILFSTLLLTPFVNVMITKPEPPIKVKEIYRIKESKITERFTDTGLRYFDLFGGTIIYQAEPDTIKIERDYVIEYKKGEKLKIPENAQLIKSDTLCSSTLFSSTRGSPIFFH